MTKRSREIVHIRFEKFMWNRETYIEWASENDVGKNFVLILKAHSETDEFHFSTEYIHIYHIQLIYNYTHTHTHMLKFINNNFLSSLNGHLIDPCAILCTWTTIFLSLYLCPYLRNNADHWTVYTDWKNVRAALWWNFN